jgi:hypothetical protein
MQYMLMFYQPAAEFEQRAETQALHASWMDYVGAIRASGIVVGGHGLHPPLTATTLRVRGDKRQVQDGPFADTKEHLGGYFVLEAPSMDAVLEWAASAPSSATGTTEVRPVMERQG